jgi:hypothetical protein
MKSSSVNLATCLWSLKPVVADGLLSTQHACSVYSYPTTAPCSACAPVRAPACLHPVFERTHPRENPRDRSKSGLRPVYHPHRATRFSAMPTHVRQRTACEPRTEAGQGHADVRRDAATRAQIKAVARCACWTWRGSVGHRPGSKRVRRSHRRCRAFGSHKE